MENGALLEQEEAFRKLNAELELRTRKLMKEVEDALCKKDAPLLWETDLSSSYKFQDELHRSETNCQNMRMCENNFSSDSESEVYQPGTRSVGYRCSSPAIKEILSPPSRRSLSPPRRALRPNSRRGTPKSSRYSGSDDVVPGVAKGIGTEGMIRFLKAKVKVLQEELATTQQDYGKRTEEWKRIQTAVKQAEEDRSKAIQEVNSARERIKKQAAQMAALQDKLQLRDSENNILKKEVDMLKQDLKKVNLSTSGNEIKLNNAKDEVEKLKHEIKKLQTKEKETRDENRAKIDNLTASVRKLEKQKSKLTTAFKKQLALIDNLKKQKNYLEANRGLKFTEEEFLKLLEWTPNEEEARGS